MTSLQEDLQRTLAHAYTIERELGGGGMSRVFVATEQALGRPVVVKVLPSETAGALSMERFRREIRLAASLQQANIVPVLSAGDADGVPYYTMPFVKGESLRARLTTKGALPVAECVAILRDVARALAYAHAEGVVHRDIKPENILLSGGTAVVTDFGIAKAVAASSTQPGLGTLTQMGVTLGTPAYMAPEQVVGGSVDHRADIYALGVVAYEMLTGETPFAGRSAQRMLAAHVVEAPPALVERCPDAPSGLIALVMRCLAKEQADRAESASAVLEALENVSGAEAIVRQPEAKPKPTIAVLPLANLSAGADDEYFADGMTEDVIAQLSQIASIRVISRTSVMPFKKTDKPLNIIAGELGASHVVEGSVRRAGQKLRIVAQLIDASTDEHLWARTFDRDVTDVFAVQAEVAEEVAAALRAKLAPAERARIARRPTQDDEAYNLYLLARHHLNSSTADGFGRAMELYHRALDRDPRFARAWGALARAHHFHLAGYYGAHPREVAEKVVEYATRALALDPEIAEAHMMLGYVDEFVHHDLASQRSRKELAVALNPNLADAHLALGNYFVVAGRYEDALQETNIALELDPASELTHLHANWLRYLTRRFDEALIGLETGEAQFGQRLLPLVHGEALLAVGRKAEAVTTLETLCRHSPITLNFGVLAWILAAAGREKDARAVLLDLHDRESREFVWPIPIAAAYAHLGDMDTAFRYLDRSVEERVAWVHMPYAPTFDVFRRDPRFEEIVRRVGAAHPMGSASDRQA